MERRIGLIRMIIYGSLVIFINLLLSSCEDERYLLTLNINNAYSDTIFVELYPNKEYLSSPGMYFIDIDQEDDSKDTHFYLLPTEMIEPIIVTSNLNSNPIDLVNRVFDSVIVKLHLQEEVEVVFCSDNVENYNVNIFIDETAWDYKKTSYESGQQNFKRTTLFIEDQYIFSISSALITAN